MGKGIHRLNAEHLRKRKGPAKLCDGGGLWLYVKRSGSKSWVYRYRLDGLDREMGLGSFSDLSVTEARKLARTYRGIKSQGIDPILERTKQSKAKRLEKARMITFSQCAEYLIQSKSPEWKNKKHAQQWKNTIETYANPVIGDLAIADIDTTLVLKILEPIWQTKTETATRLRQRIESVLDWATVREYREGKNPAVWRGHLDKLLPQPTKISLVRHQASLPYAEINQFVVELRTRDSQAARALEFLILTAVRSGEVRSAKWDEIDLKTKIWTIPAEKMKSGREHRIPLSKQALKIITKQPKLSDYVFIGTRNNQPLSDSAMRQLLKRMNHSGITVHGFRSTFRDWCAEQTNFSREVAEAALAHVLRDKTEAAYQRGDLLEKRLRLMQAWADFVYRAQGKPQIIELQARSK